MADQVMKPLPIITEFSKPYWEGTRINELRLYKCVDCGTMRHPLYMHDHFMCNNCNSIKKPEVVKASGKGKVASWTVVHRAFHAGFKAEVPYILAAVELDEGCRMWANLRGIKPEDVKYLMEVQVLFEKQNDEITLPQFGPVSK